MKKVVATLLCGLALAACTNNQQTENVQNNTNINEQYKQQKLEEVSVRVNFGAQHALVTTPQPCVMIATWDKDHTPDVMMAAWAGQLDYNQIVISLSEHKTTDNLRETKAFTVSFAD